MRRVTTTINLGEAQLILVPIERGNNMRSLHYYHFVRQRRQYNSLPTVANSCLSPETASVPSSQIVMDHMVTNCRVVARSTGGEPSPCAAVTPCRAKVLVHLSVAVINYYVFPLGRWSIAPSTKNFFLHSYFVVHAPTSGTIIVPFEDRRCPQTKRLQNGG